MEESQSEAPKSFDFSFPPHRRSPLRSETYRTLVRIMSHCHDQSQCSLTTQISAQDLKSDNGGNQAVQSCENRESVELGSDTTGNENMLAPNDTAGDKHPECSGSRDKVVSDTKRTIDEIEDIMRVEEAADKIINEGTEESGREQMILGELQDLLEGKDELAQENSVNVSAFPSKENNIFNDMFALINNEEDKIDLQDIVMEEPGGAGKLQVDKECHSQKVSGSIDSSSDQNVYIEIPKLNDNSLEKNSSLKTSMLDVEGEIQLQGESELVKPASTCGMTSSLVPIIEDEDIEEGELSGDFSLDDMSLDLLCEDTVISGEKNKDEMQASEGLVDKQGVHCNEKNDAKEKDSNSNSSVIGMVDGGGKVETDESNSNKLMSKPELYVHRMPVEAKKAHGDGSMLENERNKNEGSGANESRKSLVYYGDILEQNSCTSKKILEENTNKKIACLSAEQKNADGLEKRTQRSRSGGSKKRKKEKKRLKRAETNRQLGVKRLKLLPEVKKAVSYCRHYLKGRCQEGEKCKFSHDTIPLTKSKPCCHFARNSCMKGDNCPFDHELSKYPCNNYTSTGSCFRGDDCMFSHQMPLKEDSPGDVNASKPELKPTPLLGDSSSKKQQSTSGSAYRNANALTRSVGINSHTKSEKNVAETILKSPESAPKGISFISCGKPTMIESSKPKQVSSYPKTDNGAKVQIEQRAPPTVQILNETPKRNSPPVAPKGINFLSFGKPLGSLTRIVSPNRENQIISRPATSLPTEDNCVAIGKRKAESALGPVQNETLKKIQQVEAPFNGSSQEKQNLSDKPRSSSATQWKMPTLFTSGESSKHLALGTGGKTPKSSQKALWSTLAFAAKYESGMKMNRATGPLAPNAEANKEIGKASDILEFLSGIGNKTK